MPSSFSVRSIARAVASKSCSTLSYSCCSSAVRSRLSSCARSLISLHALEHAHALFAHGFDLSHWHEMSPRFRKDTPRWGRVRSAHLVCALPKPPLPGRQLVGDRRPNRLGVHQLDVRSLPRNSGQKLRLEATAKSVRSAVQGDTVECFSSSASIAPRSSTEAGRSPL